MLGIRSFAHGFSNQIKAAKMQPFILLFILLLLFIILRRERPARTALWLIAIVALSLTYDSVVYVPFAAFSATLLIGVLYRFGLLATIAAIFVLHLMIFFPITSDFSAWYAGDYVLALIVLFSLVVFAFYTSLAGQPLFRASLPDD